MFVQPKDTSGGSPTTALRDQALVFAKKASRDSRIRALWLVGSAARGEASWHSDIDVLVVADPSLRPSALLGGSPSNKITPFCFSSDRFAAMCERGSLFLWHVRMEGRPLFERDLFVSEQLSNLGPVDATQELSRVRQRLRVYDDLLAFNDDYLFCLSHLYVLARRTAMLILASRGTFEFGVNRPFAALSDAYPQQRDAIETLQSLRPFFETTTERCDATGEFQDGGSLDLAERALGSIRRLLDISGAVPAHG